MIWVEAACAADREVHGVSNRRVLTSIYHDRDQHHSPNRLGTVHLPLADKPGMSKPAMCFIDGGG
jgi:hypothetical protein